MSKDKSCSQAEKNQESLNLEKAILLCHLVSVRSTQGFVHVPPVILRCVVLVNQQYDWFRAVVFKPDWLDVYTFEGG